MSRRRRSKVQRIVNLVRKLLAFFLSHVGLCALVTGYTMLGAVVFRAIELPQEIVVQQLVVNDRHKAIDRMWQSAYDTGLLDADNFTATMLEQAYTFKDTLMKAIKRGYDGKDRADNPQWSMSGAFLYSLTVITTIGYGNIAPRTYFGKAITIIYAIVGVPLMLLFLANVGDILAKIFRFLYSRVDQLRRQCLADICRSRNRGRRSSTGSRRSKGSSTRTNKSRAMVNNNSAGGLTQTSVMSDDGGGAAEVVTMEELQLEALREAAAEQAEMVSWRADHMSDNQPVSYEHVTVPIWVILSVMAGYFVLGAMLFCLWEEWEFLEGFYFCYISLTTIGFGDLVPGSSIKSDDSQTQEKLVICSLYLLFGMALIAMCFSLAQEEVINKVTKVAIKLGMIKIEEDEEEGFEP